MKKIQFALDETKYKKMKKKLTENSLTWQTICEQLVDHLIVSESLDEHGIPLNEMSPSVFKKALSALEGHIETALWKYIQIKHDHSGRNYHHWMSALKGALNQIIKDNFKKTLKRGYIYDDQKLNQILDEMWPFAIILAADHLEVKDTDFKVDKPSIKELFDFADIEYPLD